MTSRLHASGSLGWSLREVGLDSVKKTRRIAEPSFSRPLRESTERPLREVRPLRGVEGREPAQSSLDWELRDIGDHPAAVDIPASGWPRSPWSEVGIGLFVVLDRVRQSTSDPLRDRNRDRVPYKTPPLPSGLSPQGGCPTRAKPLKALQCLYRWGDDPTRRQEDRRRGGNRQSRSSLQRRNRLRRQAVADAPLGPVEAQRPRSNRLGHIELRRLSTRRIVSQQHFSGISRLTRENEHASPTLSKAERATVDDPVSPPITSALKPLENRIDRRSSLQMEHEVDVLDQDPGNSPHVEQSEQVINDAALASVEARLVACHRQVLTREPGRDELGVFRQLRKIGHVCMETRLWPASSKYPRGVLAVVAEQRWAVARELQTQLKATDASEQA